MSTNYAAIIANRLNLNEKQVQNTINLLHSGATVPFVARYRKEATDSLDELQIAHIGELNEKLIAIDQRRAVIFDSISEQGKMTTEIELMLNNAVSMSELEDIYLPYKPKRKTRASMAIERGLEPLAKILSAQQLINVEKTAAQFVNKEKDVATIEEALAGARDIIAEWISENKKIREKIRQLFIKEGIIYSKIIKDKEKEGENYTNFFSYSELFAKAPSHRILAIFRGENEGFLRVNVEPDEEKTLCLLEKFVVKTQYDTAKQVWQAARDSYKRLLKPQMETETRAFYKEKADKEAINVFSDNLRQLLMTPPLGQQTILAIDPGFRTGCKVVILDKQGKLLYNETIYPHPPHAQYGLASDKLKRLVSQYKVDAIAIGNGTAGRETEHFVSKIPFERDVKAIVVSESGASVYSVSAIAREEFPDYDVTVRGAISIGRRLMDPLAELVKVEPKSIGVGQYQHDVNQNLLHKSLENTVISCVNKVGVEVNTASKELLSYVSGVGLTLAKNIVEYRNQNGQFTSRNELLNVPRFGAKAFEQAAGFLRIRGAKNPLDNSAVHPESYPIVDKMAKDLMTTVTDLMKNKALCRQIDLKRYISEKIGLPTLTDIIQELDKPGRDPRAHFEILQFDKNIQTINDLKIGMVLPGIITNITNFGCFVDVGVHQDGLVHLSQITDKYIRNPNEVVKLHQHVKVKVMNIEIERKRITLSMKELTEHS
jgi:uncharacterized protein